ncbi:MAG: hypothetical protein ACOCV2_04275 [Persicimonas sp.]
MKFKMCLLTVLFAAVVVPATALAQEYGPEDTTSIRIEEDEEDEEEKDEELRWDFRVTNEMHTFNNLDMRPLDESTAQDILDSDDRHTFGFTSIAAGASYDILDDTTFDFGASLAGMWGNDQIGATTDFGALAYIYALSVDWTAYESDNLELSTRLGRQEFRIGGTSRDFFFDDILDGATIEADFGDAGKLRVLAVDIFGDSGRPDDVDFLNYVNANKQTTNNFRGRTNVYRYGGVYELLDIADAFDMRAFAFGSYIGAARAPQEDETSTGTDRSNHGTLCNFTDNDATFMGGARGNYTLDFDDLQVGLMGEYARSGGIDRKATQLGHRDVTNNGNAFGGGAEVSNEGDALDLHGRLRYFRADGSQHTANEGLLYNHGFTSMKGAEVGGLNMDRYAGWHPSAYVSGYSGIANNPQDLDRRAGTEVMQAGFGVLLQETLRVDLDAWHYRDTGSTNVDPDEVDELANDTAWGYSEGDLRAQQRLGESLGTELNATLTFVANDALALYGLGGVFLPGAFYETEINRNAGTALGAPGNNPDALEEFWVISGGATVAF